MATLIIVTVYGFVGLVVAVWVWARQAGGSPGARVGQAMGALVLWPFLLPVLVSPGEAPGPRRAVGSERTRRLEEVAGQLEEGWRRARVEGREQRLLEGFLARLRQQEERLGEMEAALAGAPASVRERLTRLYEHSVAELERSLGLVEELAAQLTLLRFADLGNPAAVRVERGHVEELLLRIEALAEASQPQRPEPEPHTQEARV